MFPDFLRLYRKAAGLTQAALSDQSGVSRSQIANIESGIRGPAPEDIAKLIKALDLKGEEATRFEELGLAARAEQDQDLKAFVEQLRDENRLIRGRYKSAIAALGRIRDLCLKGGLKVPEDLQQAIADLEKLA